MQHCRWYDGRRSEELSLVISNSYIILMEITFASTIQASEAKGPRARDTAKIVQTKWSLEMRTPFEKCTHTPR